MAGEAIATLNAIVRMDTSGLDAGVNEAKRKLQGFEKGVSKSTFSAEKLGSILSARFLSAGAAIGLATAAVSTLRAELERLATVELGDVGILKESLTERFTWAAGDLLSRLRGLPGSPAAILGKQGARGLDWLQQQWNDFSGLSETRAAVSQDQLSKGLDAARARRQQLDLMRARIADARTGGKSAIALERRMSGEKELFDLKQELSAIADLKKRYDSLMDGMKTGADKWRESLQLLREAFDKGIIPSLREYERIVSRFKQSSGRAVEVNPMTARRAGPTFGGAIAPETQAAVLEIRNLLMGMDATGRLR